jgi:hypothetical protein
MLDGRKPSMCHMLDGRKRSMCHLLDGRSGVGYSNINYILRRFVSYTTLVFTFKRCTSTPSYRYVGR